MSWFSYALISAVLLSIATLFQKKALRHEHAMEFSATFAIIAALVAVPFFFAIDYSKIALEPLIILFINSAFGATAFYLVAKSIRHMEISSSTPLFALGPGITVFLAYLFLGERLTAMQGWGSGFLLLGAYVLEIKNHHDLFEPVKVFLRSRYIHLIMLAMVLYSVSALLDRVLLSQYNFQPEAFIAFAHLFVAFHLFIMLSIFYKGVDGVRNGLRSIGPLLLIMAIIIVVSRYSQVEAVKIAYVGLVVSVKRVSVFLTTLIGGKLFHEHSLTRKVLAALITVIGAILIAL